MKLMGIVGWRNAGKTTLVENLVRCFSLSGYEVSTLKHAHHAFDIDHPGKDSYRHRQAGAREVLVASDARWALMHEHREEGPPSLDALLAKLAPVDLVLVEGYKRHKHPKIEVYRKDNKTPLIAAEDPDICAIATDTEHLDVSCPLLPLNDAEAVARFIREHLNMGPKTALA